MRPSEDGPTTPLTCRLDALSPDERARRADVVHRAFGFLLDAREVEDGMILRFRSGKDLPALLGELIGFEHRCCPFLDFEMVVAAEPSDALLRLRGPSGVKEFLRHAFGEPLARLNF